MVTSGRWNMAAFVVRAWSYRMWGDAEAWRTYAPASCMPGRSDCLAYFSDVTLYPQTDPNTYPIRDQFNGYDYARTSWHIYNRDPVTQAWVRQDYNAFPYAQKMKELGFTAGCTLDYNGQRQFCPGDTAWLSTGQPGNTHSHCCL